MCEILVTESELSAAFDETICSPMIVEKLLTFLLKEKKAECVPHPVNIYSTFLNNGYASLSGTSTCPFITGYLFDACKT